MLAVMHTRIATLKQNGKPDQNSVHNEGKLSSVDLEFICLSSPAGR